jgi:hypothetical protein
MCNVSEYHLHIKGWVLCQNDMTATCPHGSETEIDGDIAPDSGCACGESPLLSIL